MNRFTSTITPLIRNQHLKSLLENIETAATAQAKAEVLTGILERQDRAKAKGFIDTLPESFITDIKIEKMKAAETQKASQREALKAAAALEIENVAQQQNAINPSLIPLALTDNIMAEVDKSGKMSIRFINPKTGSSLYNPRTGEHYTVAEYVASMKESTEYGNLFQNGKAGGAVVNPWRKETFNLTQQGKIHRENPALAARLMAEANQH